MSRLAIAAIVFGAVIVAAYAPCLLAPDRARIWIARFPRGKWPGRILAAVDLGWVTWLLLNAPLGRFEGLRPLLYVAVPLIFLLVVTLMDELLAPRALGGLMVLIPAPLLDIARWHESAYRLVIVVIAYILVVEGIILLLSPYQFRKATAFWIRSNALCRTWGLLGVATGAFVILLGIAVF